LTPSGEMVDPHRKLNKKDGYRQRQFLLYQPKAHYLATSRESRRYVVAYSRFEGAACWHLATSRESKAHFGLPWVRPWDYCAYVTWMERGFNACQTHRSMYPLIKPVSSYVRHFSTFICTFWPPLDNRSKCYIDGKSIQCL